MYESKDEYYIQDIKTKKEAPVGEDGEILISGPTVMLGYLDNKKETDATFVTIKGKKYLPSGIFIFSGFVIKARSYFLSTCHVTIGSQFER